jgi:hypothetical protein
VNCRGTHNATTLGLDWDDTVTLYPEAFRALIKRFKKVYIITINHGVTPEETERLLEQKADGIYHCPDETVINGQSHIWKADVCQELNIDLMFDDDTNVINECRRRGITAIAVTPVTREARGEA